MWTPLGPMFCLPHLTASLSILGCYPPWLAHVHTMFKCPSCHKTFPKLLLTRNNPLLSKLPVIGETFLMCSQLFSNRQPNILSFALAIPHPQPCEERRGSSYMGRFLREDPRVRCWAVLPSVLLVVRPAVMCQNTPEWGLVQRRDLSEGHPAGGQMLTWKTFLFRSRRARASRCSSQCYHRREEGV